MIPMINHMQGGMSVQIPEPLDPDTTTYALIDPQGNVVNTIVWDGQSPYNPPHGHQLVQTRAANIGDIFDGQTFTRSGQPIPNPPQKPTTP